MWRSTKNGWENAELRKFSIKSTDFHKILHILYGEFLAPYNLHKFSILAIWRSIRFYGEKAEFHKGYGDLRYGISLNYFVNLNFELIHDLHLWFWRSNFERDHRLRANERDVSWGCWTHYMTLSYDLDLGFSRSNFEKSVSLEWGGQLTWIESDESIGSWTEPLCDFQLWPHLWPWPWIFKVKFFKKLYLRNGMVNWHEMKGTWVDRMLNLLCDLELWSWPWTSKVKLWISRITRMGGPIDME